MNLRTGIILFLALFVNLVLIGCKDNAQTNNTVAIDQNVIKNITYGQSADWEGHPVKLDLDIYAPPTMQKGRKYPLVLFIHGGGYLTGDKESVADKCSILADSGFIAVSLNYRLGWTKGEGQCNGNVAELFNAAYRCIQDANAALRFLVSDAKKYSIDTNWIFVGGSSAGAIAALCTVYLHDNDTVSFFANANHLLGSLDTADNNLKNRYSIKGIACISGGLPDSSMLRPGTIVPTIFFQGGKDETAPPETGHYYSCDNYPAIAGAVTLYRTTLRNNVPTIMHLIPDAGHGHDGDSGYSDEVKLSSAASFFKSIINKDSIKTGLYYDKPTSQLLLKKIFHKRAAST